MSDTPTDQLPDLDQVHTSDEEIGTPDQTDDGSFESTVDYLDIDDDMGGKYVRVKVDGEELSVPLKEALQGYQRQEAFTRRSQEVAEQRREAQRAIQLQQALQANPGLTMQILADQAGMSVHDFLGLSPAQQQAAVQAGEGEQQYVDPLEQALAEERQARQALEQRFLQREADEQLRVAVDGLKQQFSIDDDMARQVVAAAYQMGLPTQAFPMIYQSMAFQQMQARNGARQDVASTQAAQDEQRRQAAAAAGQIISTGQGATGVQGTPANQEFTNYRDAIVAAFETHGDVA